MNTCNWSYQYKVLSLKCNNIVKTTQITPNFVQMNSKVYGEYILLRDFEVISFFGRGSNWFLYPMNFFFFFCIFLTFYEKNVADVHKWLQICTKIDSSKVFAHELYYSHHTLDIHFTAVKSFEADIHIKTSKFTFSAVFIAKFVGHFWNFVIR